MRAVELLSINYASPLIGLTGLNNLVEALQDQLLQIVTKALTLELSIQRIAGNLRGASPSERFADFAASFSSPNARRRLFSQYPVLLRRCIACCDDWVASTSEMVSRLAQDAHQLRVRFAVDGAVANVFMAAGDPHRRGRRVMKLVFANGQHLVYKPRPLRAATAFQNLLSWMNAKGMKPSLPFLQVVDMGEYGWSWFVPHQPTESIEQVRSYYERLGALLCLLTVLRATDAHFENIVACGEYPYLVDLETLLLPQLVGAPPANATGHSLLNVGLLPTPTLAGSEVVDLSGMGARPNQLTTLQTWTIENAGTDTMRTRQVRYQLGDLHHLPSFSGNYHYASDNIDSVISGYRKAHGILATSKDELLTGDVFAELASCEVRVLLRPTAIYSALLQESIHPTAVGDALDTDLVLAQIWRGASSNAVRSTSVLDEYRQLQHGDVPYFSCLASSLELRGSDNAPLRGIVQCAGIDCVRTALAGIRKEDVHLHEWIIRGSFIALTQSERMVARSAQVPCGGMSAYEFAFDWLKTHRLTGRTSATWLTLSSPDENPLAYTISECSLDLYGGLAGVALFLFALARHSGSAEHFRIANETLEALQHLNSRTPELSAGAFNGQAGVLYVYSLVARWFPQYRQHLAPSVAQLVDKLVDSSISAGSDLVSGLAGIILCMLEQHGVCSCDAALRSAVDMGDSLLRRLDVAPLEPALALELPYERGLSHGLSGVSLALYTLGVRAQLPRFSDTALKLCSAERARIEEDGWTSSGDLQHAHQNTWCHGATGVACSRLAMHLEAPAPGILADLNWCLPAAAEAPRLENDSLCHGEWGNAEPLLFAATGLSDQRWGDAFRMRQAQLDASQRVAGISCATPGGFAIPGLMTGISGVGYAALRAISPHLFPSVLTLGAGSALKTE